MGCPLTESLKTWHLRWKLNQPRVKRHWLTGPRGATRGCARVCPIPGCKSKPLMKLSNHLLKKHPELSPTERMEQLKRSGREEEEVDAQSEETLADRTSGFRRYKRVCPIPGCKSKPLMKLSNHLLKKHLELPNREDGAIKAVGTRRRRRRRSR